MIQNDVSMSYVHEHHPMRAAAGDMHVSLSVCAGMDEVMPTGGKEDCCYSLDIVCVLPQPLCLNRPSIPPGVRMMSGSVEMCVVCSLALFQTDS